MSADYAAIMKQALADRSASFAKRGLEPTAPVPHRYAESVAASIPADATPADVIDTMSAAVAVYYPAKGRK